MKAFPSMTQFAHRAMLDALVDLSPDPSWVIDGAGTIVAANSAFQRWQDQIAPQLEPLQRRALTGRSIMADIRVADRTFSLQARPVDGGGVAFVARVVESEHDGSTRAIELALMHLFASTDPLSVVIDKALEFFCTAERWDAAALWRIDQSALRVEATWFVSDELRDKLAHRLRELAFQHGEGTPGRAWASRDVIWVADMLEESSIGRAELAAAAGLHSVVAAPLVDADRVTGVLELFTHSVRPISEPTRRMLASTGAAIARLIERRQLLDQIANKGAEWLLTVDSIRMPILLVTDDARVARMNRTAQQLAGRPYEEILGRPLSSLGEGEPWTTLRDIATAVRESGMTCTAQIVAGETNWDVTASPIAASADDDNRIVIAMRDTTEIVRLQESVRRGEQLAALGELVAGVAHEIKNPLFGMSATLELLDEYLEGRTEPLELTAALRKWIARLLSLTENLLAYGKTWSTDMKSGDLHDVLSSAIETTQALARDAEVRIEAEVISETVLMDASRLVLVFENLLANAVQHSEAGRRVFVTTNRDIDGVVITVRDEGHGFAPSELTRVFQPFYTRRRGGTGLGLSIVQRIVDEHGGIVTARNAIEGGAAVDVRLPAFRTAP